VLGVHSAIAGGVDVEMWGRRGVASSVGFRIVGYRASTFCQPWR
jgi:hypothetical protein